MIDFRTVPLAAPGTKHTRQPDCFVCRTAIATAGAQAFKEARRQARRTGAGNGQHVLGQHPIADAACEAAERAETVHPRCFDGERD